MNEPINLDEASNEELDAVIDDPGSHRLQQAYARERKVARGLRLAGKIESALWHEARSAEIYRALPRKLRW